MANCVRDVTPQVQVSTVMVRSLAGVIRERVKAPQGVSLGVIDQICAESAERMFPFSELQTLLADAVRKTGEPALGLHWGMHAKSSSFGLMTPLISYAATLREALALVSQFCALMAEGARLQLEERMGLARLNCALPPGTNIGANPLVEMMLAGLVRMFGEFGCTPKDIRGVCFEYARPGHYPAYALAFSGTERFAQPFTGIEFAGEALDRRHMHRNPELLEIMRAQAERSLQSRRRPRRYADRVLALLYSSPPNQIPEMKDIARLLAVGERTLRRRLHEERITYRELTQSFQYNAACSMLRNADLTLQQVAGALGFGDSAAFHRAFRRWSNLTPEEYRDSVFDAPPRELTTCMF
ncbi:MAG TPA: AraC family transcriptional regulator ligand-binding domain-containing protein [Polyangiales bacterium]|nr:AraC family transcriptional regulator ligand-binding domain-containing protein [Polyangiales bacterium]